MPTKKYDLAVKTGTYTDRATGTEKSRYQNIGAMMVSDDGRDFVLLDPLINLAAVPREPGRDRVIVSCFEPRDPAQQAQQAPRQAQGARPQPQRQAPASFDDEVPF